MSQARADSPQLVAELEVFSSSDALQWAKSSRFSGRLAFRSARCRVTLYLEAGAIVQAASSRRVEALGRHLFAEGLIDEIDLAAAIVHSRDSQTRIGTSMVELGVLSPEVLRRALHDHIINLATLPVTWRTGRLLAEKRAPKTLPSPPPEPVDAIFVLMEASRRQDELTAFEDALPHRDAILKLVSSTLPEAAPPSWQRVVATYEPGSSVRSHYERLGGCYFRFVSVVRQLLASEILGFADSATERALDLSRTS